MDNKLDNQKDQKFWKSLRELENDSESLKLKHNEFSEGVTDDFELSKLTHFSRRKFLALMAASAAVTATACSDYHDKGEIVPYTKKPEEIMPGIPNLYASTCTGCSNSCGILVTTREGRPIKIDGNPDHPLNKGKICAKGQASILNLYDPERLRYPLYKNEKISWNEIDKKIIDLLNKASEQGKEIALVTHSVNSPTFKKLLDDLSTKYPTTKIYSYELFNDINKTKAWKEIYGVESVPKIKLGDANVILSLESDFLGTEDNFIENTRSFTERRDIDNVNNFNKLFVFEGGLSLTGMNADYRFRLKPDSQIDLIYTIINELLSNNNFVYPNSSDILNKVSGYTLKGFVAKYNLKEKEMKVLINDLIKERGKAIVLAGNKLSYEVHIAVNILNDILGATNLYENVQGKNSFVNLSDRQELLNLAGKIKSGTIGVLINAGANPVYHFGFDKSFTEDLKKLSAVVSLLESKNETSAVSDYVLPVHHDLESWGDAQFNFSDFSLKQPVISPLFETRQKEAVILNWLSGDNNSYSEDIYHKYLKNNWENNIYPIFNTSVPFERFWFSSLHDGVALTNLKNTNTFTINIAPFLNIADQKKADGFLLVLNENYYLGDGRFANNGWLLEMPHPVSKITWDNYISISPTSAKELNLEMNNLAEIETGEIKLTLPVCVQPGVSDNTIYIDMGFGRTEIGEVGKDVGVNVNSLLSNRAGNSDWIKSGVKLSKVSGTHKLATVQEHHALDDTFVKDFHLKRNIIQEGTIDKYNDDPEFLKKKKHKVFSITKSHEYAGIKWGMSVDLNKCTACGICTTACNVENNIPVVGKDQVLVGREMSWIRVDRYYSGTPDEPVTSNQPMLCQHCDNAPCENVCPVNATNHSPDGLNQMAYNRCVGTRYCANNCPYKVRRYNFFDFRDHVADSYYKQDTISLMHNPEVTVRARGVMEKCTFCVQRIMEARSNAIKEGRELKGSDVKTACQVACPADAIIFGDMNDPESEISKAREHNLGYHVLEELNVRPNVTYIAKLRNTLSEDK